MNQRQRLVVVALAIADLLVLIAMCGVVAIMATRAGGGEQAAMGPTDVPTPSVTPSQTPIPTWTPRPTPTIYVQPPPTPRPLTEEETLVLDQVERDVSELRGLDALEPVSHWVLTRAQLRQYYANLLGDEAWRSSADSLTLALAALDFVPADTDLVKLWRDVYSEQVAGFYDTETKEIILVTNTDASGALERVIYAHEYTHALQDQHFDLRGLGVSETDFFDSYVDRVGAVLALVEGDASLVQEQYVQGYLSYADTLAFQQDVAQGSSIEFDRAPRFIQQMMLFPYERGRQFVGLLYTQGGWAAVDAAYEAPPVSSEQILHPERYLVGDAPTPVSLGMLDTVLGTSWTPVYDEPLGEFVLGLYLENYVSSGTASAAVEGWGGDRCIIYHHAGTAETAFLLHTVWDTAAEADEFRDAYETYAQVRSGHLADLTGEGLTCWSGDDWLCVSWEGDAVTVVLGPDRATVEAMRAAALSP